jgi:hypothetical protein
MSKAIAATAARVGETPVIKNWLLDEEFLEKLKELYGPDYDWAVNTMSHESSGIANAHNTGTQDNPEDSRGLMQINWNFWGSEPNFREEFKDLIKSEEDLFDPIINAMAGKYILATEGKSPWAGTREKVEQSLAKDDGFSLISPASAADVRDEDVPEIVTKFTKVEGEPAKEETTVKGKLSGDFDPSQWIVPSTAAAEEPKISMLSDFDPEEWVTQPWPSTEELTSEVQQTSLLEDARLAGITGPEMDLSAGAEVWPPEDSPYRPTDALHGDITRGNILRAAGMPQEGPIPPGYAHGFAPGIAAPEERGFPPPPIPTPFTRRAGGIPASMPEGGFYDQPGWAARQINQAQNFIQPGVDAITDVLSATDRAALQARDAITGGVTGAADAVTAGLSATDRAVLQARDAAISANQSVADATARFLGLEDQPLLHGGATSADMAAAGQPWYQNQALGQAIWKKANQLVDLPTQGQIRFLNNTFGKFPEFGYYILNQFRPEDKPLTTTWGTTEYLSQLPDKSIREVVKAVANKDNLKNIWSGIGEAVMREGELIPSIRDAISPVTEPSADLAGELQNSIAESLTGSPDASTGELIDALGSMVGGWGADIGEAVGDVYTRVREDPSGAFEDFTGAVGTGFTAAKDLVGAGLDMLGRDEVTPQPVDTGVPNQHYNPVSDGGNPNITSAKDLKFRGSSPEAGATSIGSTNVLGQDVSTTPGLQTSLPADYEKEMLDINSTANWLTGLSRLIGASDPGPAYRSKRTEQLRLTYDMQRDLLGLDDTWIEIWETDEDGNHIPGKRSVSWPSSKRLPGNYTKVRPSKTKDTRATSALNKELVASIKSGKGPVEAAQRAINKYKMVFGTGDAITGMMPQADDVLYTDILMSLQRWGKMNNIPQWENITLDEIKGG